MDLFLIGLVRIVVVWGYCFQAGLGCFCECAFGASGVDFGTLFDLFAKLLKMLGNAKCRKIAQLGSRVLASLVYC